MRITPIAITGTPAQPYVYCGDSISFDDWEKRRRKNGLKFQSEKDDVSFFMSDTYDRVVIIPEDHPFFNFTIIVETANNLFNPFITGNTSSNDKIKKEIKKLLIDKYVKVLYL